MRGAPKIVPAFEARLIRATARLAGSTPYMLRLHPELTTMPLPMQRYDDPFLPWGKAIIDATRALVAGYVFDLAAYMAIGAAGAVALERTIAYIRPDHSVLSILHAPFWGTAYARAVSDDALAVDGVTLCRAQDAAAYRALGVQPFLLMGGSGEAWMADEARFYLTTHDGKPVLLPLLPSYIIIGGRREDFAEKIAAAIRKL